LVLDIGCGTGRYSYLFNGTLVGLDLSYKYLRKAKNDKNHYVQGDSSHLSFKGAAFNTIFSVGLFHHLNDNSARKTINEIVRCAREDSKIIIIDPLLPKRKFDFMGYLFVWLDRGNFIRGRDALHRILCCNYSVRLLEEGHISKSYPYNPYFYVLTKQPKEIRQVD
jgi:SAM-dependent methyltransferase